MASGSSVPPWHRIERLTVHGILGAVLAAGGVFVIFRDRADLNVPGPALFAILAGAACIAEASVLAKRFPPGSPIAANAVAMLLGAALLGALTLVTWSLRVAADGSTWRNDEQADCPSRRVRRDVRRSSGQIPRAS